MTRIGLTLNEAKTSLQNARQERFDFLGFSFGPHRYELSRERQGRRINAGSKRNGRCPSQLTDFCNMG
jgi:hypothetical protein